jgi:hypothetical protein
MTIVVFVLVFGSFDGILNFTVSGQGVFGVKTSREPNSGDTIFNPPLVSSTLHIIGCKFGFVTTIVCLT